MTIPIPPDEALRSAYFNLTRHCPHDERLRAVATLAAKQAAEQAVKEAVLRIGSRLMGLPSREYRDVMTVLTTDFPSAFTPTPPKEQPVTQTAAAPRDFHIGSAQRVLAGDADGLFDFVPWSGTPQGHKFWSATYAEMEAGKPLRAEAREIIEGWLRASGVVASPSPDPATVRLCIDFLKGGSHNGAAIMLESLLPKPAPEPERYVTVREVMDIIAPLCSTTGDIIGIKTQLLERAALRRAAKGGEGK